MDTLWAERYAQRTYNMQASAVRELLKLTEQPEIISFAGGLPAPDVFPVDRFKDAAARILTDYGARALQYSTSEGCRPLREFIADRAGRYGINVGPENILITSGSQQALDLIGKVFINVGDHILCERPTYVGALQAWKVFQAEYACVRMDDDGMRTDDIETVIRGGPKFIYALPNFQNPTGVTMSLVRRLALIELADHYGVPILEDDPYGQLRFEGEHLPSLVTLDAKSRGKNGSRYSGNVIYLSTFSKTLAPGLRIGWIIAPEEVIQRLVMAKQGSDLHSSTFSQMLAYEVAKDGFFDQQVHLIRSVYRERRDAMLKAMATYMPARVTWTKPDGGLFLWLTFPDDVDAREVLKLAVAEKVAFVPGTAFFPDGGGANAARINFSYVAPDRIVEGVRRLARVIERSLADQAAAQGAPRPVAAP